MMNLYIDIDGVLLTKKGEPVAGIEIFLDWAVENHEPYWISTRTRDGTHRGALNAFFGILDPALVQAVNPLAWNVMKTEALPLNSRNWIWIDDEILPTERDTLVQHSKLDRFFQINVAMHPNALLDLPSDPIFHDDSSDGRKLS